jgi:hypothetical protein
MALPHKEWRAYLDTILDSYIRTNVTVDAVGYMVDRMEEVGAFSIAHKLAGFHWLTDLPWSDIL